MLRGWCGGGGVVGLGWQGSYCFIAVLMVLCGSFDGFSWLRAGYGAWRVVGGKNAMNLHTMHRSVQ